MTGWLLQSAAFTSGFLSSDERTRAPRFANVRGAMCCTLITCLALSCDLLWSGHAL